MLGFLSQRVSRLDLKRCSAIVWLSYNFSFSFFLFFFSFSTSETCSTFFLAFVSFLCPFCPLLPFLAAITALSLPRLLSCHLLLVHAPCSRSYHFLCLGRLSRHPPSRPSVSAVHEELFLILTCTLLNAHFLPHFLPLIITKSQSAKRGVAHKPQDVSCSRTIPSLIFICSSAHLLVSLPYLSIYCHYFTLLAYLDHWLARLCLSLFVSSLSFAPARPSASCTRPVSAKFVTEHAPQNNSSYSPVTLLVTASTLFFLDTLPILPCV